MNLKKCCAAWKKAITGIYIVLLLTRGGRKTEEWFAWVGDGGALTGERHEDTF